MKQALIHLGKVLSFRSNADDMARWGKPELALGLLLTVLVGAGRWWDDTRDLPLYVHLGIGSVAYVLVLSSILWVLNRTLADAPATFQQVLTFVCFVSPPAALYAIPVERWVGMAAAQQLNLQFLGLVALYRVALLIHFCIRSLRLNTIETITTTFLPISIAVFFVAMLNVTHIVIDFMGGVRGEPNRKLEMETFVMFLSCLSWVVAPLLTLVYLSMLLVRWQARRASRKVSGAGEDEPPTKAD